MADCRKCKHNYKMPGDEPRCNRMCDGESDFDPITNSMRIRKMSDEELAEYIFGVSIGNVPCVLCSEECAFCELSDEQCKEKTLKWLKSEVKQTDCER